MCLEFDILFWKSRKLDKITQSIIQLGDEDKAGIQKVTTQLSQCNSQLDAGVKAGFQTVSSELLQSTSQLSTQLISGLSTLRSQNASTESANEEKHHSILAHLDDHTKIGILNNVKIGEVCQQQVKSSSINEAGFEAVHSSMLAASSANSEEHKTTHAMLSHYQGLIQGIIRNHITFETIDRGVHSPSTRPKAVGGTHTTSTVYWKYRELRLPIGLLNVTLSQTRQTKRSRLLEPQDCAESGLEVIFVPPRWLSSVVLKYSMNLYCDLISNQWRWGATLTPLTINDDPFFREAIRYVNLEDLRTSFSKGLAKSTDLILHRGLPVPWYRVCLKSAFNSDVLNSSRRSLLVPTCQEEIVGLNWHCSSISWQRTIFLASKWFQVLVHRRLQNLMIVREKYVYELDRLSPSTNITNVELDYIHKYLKRGGKFFGNSHLNANWWYCGPLGCAAAEGNINVVYLLLEAGAESSYALQQLLEHNEHVPDGIFRRMLWTLVENARPVPFYDPMFSIMRSSRALTLHPRHQRFSSTEESLLTLGWEEEPLTFTMLYWAIRNGQDSVVDLLLQYGAMADATVSGHSNYQWERFESCTWITFSVLCGAAACADVLIRHGSDVTALDQSGRSAIQLAKMNVLASHPRRVTWKWRNDHTSVTAEEDAETLAVVERAFNDRFRGMKSIEDHIKSINKLPVESPRPQKRPKPMFREIMDKALGKFLTASQTERLYRRLEDLYLEARKTCSLSFYEALLLRVFYVYHTLYFLVSKHALSSTANGVSECHRDPYYPL